MYQKVQRAVTLVLSIVACYTSFLAVLRLCFDSGERINIKINQSFRIDIKKQMISSENEQIDNLSITNNNNSLNFINELFDKGYNKSQEITSYANTQNKANCKTNLGEFQIFMQEATDTILATILFEKSFIKRNKRTSNNDFGIN